MLVLREEKSNKIPETSSVFLILDCYIPKNVFDVLIQMENSVYDYNNKEFEFPINSLKFVVDVLTAYDDVKFIPMAEEIPERVEIDKSKFIPNLFSNQLTAIQYGIQKDGWMLLDDCGLGKTASMICLAEEAKRRYGIEHCLIVCGVNSLKYNWQAEVEKHTNEKGYILGNLDATVCAQAPKLAPHIEKMRENIARVFDTDIGNVSVKATTEEKLGFTGREEGACAHSVAMLTVT